MLLELDVRTLTELLQDNQILSEAVDKSKAALRSLSHPSQQASHFHSDPPHDSPHDIHNSSRDDVAVVIYDKASTLHPECASQITGTGQLYIHVTDSFSSANF